MNKNNIFKTLQKLFLLVFFIFSQSSCLFNDSGTSYNQVTVLNNFDANIVYEVWSGDSIAYHVGKVEGNNLKEEQSLTPLGLGSSDKISIEQNDKTVLVIFGIDEGSADYYQGDATTDTGNTVEIDGSGNISVY